MLAKPILTHNSAVVFLQVAKYGCLNQRSSVGIVPLGMCLQLCVSVIQVIVSHLSSESLTNLSRMSAFHVSVYKTCTHTRYGYLYIE